MEKWLYQNNNAQTLQTSNASIAPTELQANNERSVNELYLSTLAKGSYTIDEAQTTLLHDLAFQCPELGGTAVFKARALYEYWFEMQTWDDEAACANAGSRVKTRKRAKAPVQETKLQVNIIPNPADEIATISFADLTTEEMSLTIYNTLGQIVMTQKISTYTANHVIVTNKLNAGVYYFLLQGNTQKAEGKFVVVH